MKLVLHITKVMPHKFDTHLLEKVGIEELIVEDVSAFQVTENGINLNYNSGKEEFIRLRDNYDTNGEDWRGAAVYITRKFLEVK